jgi:hypothetical protein
MHKCKLMYRQQVLKNKAQKLYNLFDPSNEVVHTLRVVYLNDFESLNKDTRESVDKYTEYAKKYPILIVAVLVLIFLFLTVTLS